MQDPVTDEITLKSFTLHTENREQIHHQIDS